MKCLLVTDWQGIPLRLIPRLIPQALRLQPMHIVGSLRTALAEALSGIQALNSTS